jgi:hypothetical protein
MLLNRDKLNCVIRSAFRQIGKELVTVSEREPRFHPIGMLPVIAELIDGYAQDASTLLPDLRRVRSQPQVFDDAVVDRLEAIYGETAAMLPIFEEQLRRWGESALTASQRAEVARLFDRVSHLRPMAEEVLALAAGIRRGTINRVMEKSDLELGLEALLRMDGR